MDDLSKIFRIALITVLKEQPRGTKAKISRDTGVKSSQLSDIISQRLNSSEEQRRAIAAALGYSGRAYEDFLDIGRELLGRSSRAEQVRLAAKAASQVKAQRAAESITPPADLLTAGLTPGQVEVLQAYRELLLMGGEGVESISELIINMANKKRASQGTAANGKTA